MITKNNYLPFAIVSNVLWALIVIFTVELKNVNIDQTQMLFFMMGFNAIIMGFFTFQQRDKIKKEFNKDKIKMFIGLVLIGSVSFIIYRLGLYYGLQNSNAFVVNSINYTWVIFLIITSSLLKVSKEPLDFYTKYIFFFGLVGVFLIFDLFNNNNTIDLVYLLIIVSSFMTALDTSIIIKIKEKIIDNFYFIYFIYSLIVFTTIGIAGSTMDLKLIPETNEQIYYLLGFSLLFLVTMTMWIRSYHVGDKILVPFLGYIIPILSNTLLIVLYDYEVTTSIVIGSIIIIGSGLLLNKTIKEKILLRIKFYQYNWRR